MVPREMAVLRGALSSQLGPRHHKLQEARSFFNSSRVQLRLVKLVYGARRRCWVAMVILSPSGYDVAIWPANASNQSEHWFIDDQTPEIAQRNKINSIAQASLPLLYKPCLSQVCRAAHGLFLANPKSAHFEGLRANPSRLKSFVYILRFAFAYASNNCWQFSRKVSVRYVARSHFQVEMNTPNTGTRLLHLT
jgi:hypothetical protein